MARLWELRDLIVDLNLNSQDAQLQIRWQQGTLQSAPYLTGPWEDVQDALSPMPAPGDGDRLFNRIRLE